ncbi:MAG TPA: TldD/PmbA family protein [Firmicutes bacterium]|nr:TldD/PmbA family protein [Bacillota bacterium]
MLNIDLLFEQGRASNLTDMEVYVSVSNSFSCKVFEQAVDSYSVSRTQGISFRGIYEGKMGYTYTELMDDSSIPFLIKSVIDNASIIEKEDNEELFNGSEHYTDLSLYDSAFENVTAEQKIDFLKEVESACKALDSRVKSVSYCLFANGTSEITLKNTKGLDLSERSNYAYAYIDVLVTENGENKDSGKFITSTTFSDYMPAELAKEIVTEAVSKLGSKKVRSGKYPIVLKNLVAADMLNAMSNIFSAEAVHKNLSLFKDKISNVVASECVTIVDDPHLLNGLGSQSFDGEGVATYYKEVISNGVLETYLHSLTTAKIFGVTPTGNGSRGSYKSLVGISPSNLYVKSGPNSFEEVISSVNNGLYITDVQGLHSGLNSISGDFSLSASGFMIENGIITFPVHEITIAGNFFDMLKSIDTVANNLEFGMSGVGSPALLINKLTVAGE